MGKKIKIAALILLSCLFSGGGLAATPDAESDYKLGLADWEQRGDPVTAMVPLKKAADAGHAAAQALYGYLLDQADNDEEAAEYYRRSAAQGDPDGLYGLASFHVSGDGGVKADLLEARRLFIKSAEAGNKQSLAIIVLAYIGTGNERPLGLTAEEQASPEALKWIKKGVEAKIVPAMNRMILVFQNGEFGVPKDVAAANALQAEVYQLQGIDPNSIKKRRRK